MDPTIHINIPMIPATVYAAGFVINITRVMDQTGSNEMETYRKNAEVQKEQLHQSEYAAYWTGCRTGLLYGVVDSAIWPVKLVTFAVYLLRKNANSKNS